MNAGSTITGVVTGKPVHLGSLGRSKATGRGVFISGREVAQQIGLDLKMLGFVYRVSVMWAVKLRCFSRKMAAK